MKAFIIDRYGKKDVGRIADMPEPTLRDDDVLVEIHAASINPLDSKIRTGEFKLLLPYKLPLIMGNDLAGVVVRVGSKVRRFKPGDEVYARPDADRSHQRKLSGTETGEAQHGRSRFHPASWLDRLASAD